MNRFFLKLKVLLLSLLVLAVIFGTGWMAYQSLSYVISTIDEEARPDLKLELLKDINDKLARVESSIKYYMLTKDDKYLKPYYQILTSVDKQIEELTKLSGKNSEENAQLEKVGKLIEEKFWVWDQMLSLQNDSRVHYALDELSMRFQVKTDSIKVIKTQPDSIVFDTILVEAKKGKILQRIFSRKKKQEETIVKIDTIRKKEKHENFEKVVIESEVKRLKEADEILVKELAEKELRIIKKNEIIGRELHQMISQMEQKQLKAINNKIEEANSFTLTIKKWLGLFCLIASLLLIILLLVIFRFSGKSNAFQKALLEAKVKAEDLSLAKAQFLANMSHEIRTPMNAIVGFTNQILQLNKDPKQLEQLNIVKKAADHLLRLINEILDFSKLESGKIIFETISFKAEEVLDDVYKLYKPIAENKALEFTSEIENPERIVLSGDPFRLRQILLNLVSNSIKFTSSGTVSIRAIINQKSKKGVVLSIEVNDTGIGIQKEKLKEIFKEFTQADAHTSRNYGGTGLGLSIVKKLVDLQKGTINVSSNYGENTTIKLEIPYLIGKDPVGAIEAKSELPGIESLKNINILLADDEEFNKELICFILEKWNIRHTAVNNGKELLEAFEKEKFDLILMDVRMPVMTGIQASEILRKQKSEIPIIALTATSGKEDTEKCLKAGINKVLLKPFLESELQKSILELLNIEGAFQTNPITGSESDAAISKENPSSFSLEKLYHLASNDKAFVREMLEMFVCSTREGLADLWQGLNENNRDKISLIAHKICSPCRHLEADNLVIKLKNLEKNATNTISDQTLKDWITDIEKEALSIIFEAEEVLKTQFKL